MPDTLPRWDLSNLYSGLDSPEFKADFQRLGTLLDELQTLFDHRGIRRASPEATSTDELPRLLEDILERSNAIALLEDLLGGFAHALLTTNSYDATAARETSKLELLSTRRQQLDVRFKGWVGSLKPAALDHACGDAKLADYRFYLTDAARQSQYLMAEDLENLAAELCLDSGVAFGKLQGNVTSQLKVPFERDGVTTDLPITVIRNFLYDSDADLRQRAYQAEIKGWESIRTTVAACLNGVKGTVVKLARRRGRASVLDAALDENRIDRPTLDALLGATREAFPTFRRYLRSKARKLGHANGKLPWWDLFAPLGSADQHFTWPDARDFIVEKFGAFSNELGDYAAQAFDQHWIDAEPRDGKRGGAFCMPVIAKEESRILANFNGSFDEVSTLAHELGHGFHNHCQAGLTPLRRGSPSTLAETASIFCETLTAEAALREASPAEQLMILETQLIGATQVCLDISSRYLFESAVCERRAGSELSPDDFCDLMRAAQAETYADALEESTYHPYMWLWKPHYYAYEHNFYNFPYAFGHLFGLGLYAIYLREGAAFIPRYRELLRSTGQNYAAPLAAQFGLDITQLDFWRASLAIIEQQVTRYEEL